MSGQAGATGDGGGVRLPIIAGLARLIWTPPAGVSAFDRVEAVRLLGRLDDPTALRFLIRVLNAGPRRLQPPGVGRWLRDTALDTLLRLPNRAAANRALAAYYRLPARLLRGRLDRNLVYDDIPLLLTHGRGGLVVRGYLVPLIAGLLLLPLLAEGLAAWVGPEFVNSGPGFLLGGLFFVALGLGLFNAHQVALVLLVAWLGPRLLLPTILPARKIGVAVVLALAAFGLALAGTVGMLALISGRNAPTEALVQGCLLALPLLTLPCYMLAHDLETGAREAVGPAANRLRLAVVLRWASGALYLAFVLIAFGLSFFQQLTPQGAPPENVVLLGMLPAVVYLALAPLPVLLVLAGLGGLQRRLMHATAMREET
ncbi:MAG: hypothetical protein M3Z04_09205 [Chloroflexota bacterium]|nr:hypothetical protein [Chloroflexota bacterium]